MNCSICNHSKSAEIIIDYARTKSLRKTAKNYAIGYRSLARHIQFCIYALLEEAEQLEFEEALETAKQMVIEHYQYEMTRKRRKKSIIKKHVEFSWSRRSWAKKAKNKA